MLILETQGLAADLEQLKKYIAGASEFEPFSPIQLAIGKLSKNC